jgi:hypothetical protein
MVMIVEVMASSCAQSRNNKETDKRKKMPVIKASLDKNNSQRMGNFRLK